MYPAPVTNRKKPTMNNNPFQPIPQRPERIDRKWDQDRDPIFYQAFDPNVVRYAR